MSKILDIQLVQMRKRERKRRHEYMSQQIALKKKTLAELVKEAGPFGYLVLAEWETDDED